MDQASRGAAALAAGNYTKAIADYTAAISSQPEAVDYYIKRSTAYQRNNPPALDLALQDAETAVALAYKRAKRELIAEAQLRRAIALFALAQYNSARIVLQYVKKFNEKEKSLPIWTKKIEEKLKKEVVGDDISEGHTKEIPSPRNLDNDPTSRKIMEGSKIPGPVTSSEEPAQSQTLQTPTNKIRHEWYQNSDNIYVTIFAKGVPKEKVNIEINEHSVTISFPTVDSSLYEFSLDPLFAPVDISMSSSKVLNTKVEVTLKKKISGQKWKSLEGTVPLTAVDNLEPAAGSVNKDEKLPVNKTIPVYPTSSRSGPKDWDKVAAELTQRPKANSEGENEVEDIEEEGGDPVNAFFKKLYAGADPDTRRAMMKSYQESNGTALSTNWADVSKGPVETSPPDGMVAKKWGE